VCVTVAEAAIKQADGAKQKMTQWNALKEQRLEGKKVTN